MVGFKKKTTVYQIVSIYDYFADKSLIIRQAKTMHLMIMKKTYFSHHHSFLIFTIDCFHRRYHCSIIQIWNTNINGIVTGSYWLQITGYYLKIEILLVCSYVFWDKEKLEYVIRRYVDFWTFIMEEIFIFVRDA